MNTGRGVAAGMWSSMGATIECSHLMFLICASSACELSFCLTSTLGVGESVLDFDSIDSKLVNFGSRIEVWRSFCKVPVPRARGPTPGLHVADRHWQPCSLGPAEQLLSKQKKNRKFIAL